MINKTNSELKKLTKDYFGTFNDFCERSREERLKELQPGEYAPEKGKLYGSYRDKMENKAAEIRNAANSILEAELEKAKEKVNAAPSTDAVNTISLLKLRDPKALTKNQFTSLLDKYGDNPLCFDTIRDLGKQAGIVTDYEFTEHPARVELENIEVVSKNLNRAFNVYDTEKGYNSEVYQGMLCGYIDKAFPSDPE